MKSPDYVFKILTKVAQEYHEFAIVQNALAQIADELREKWLEE